MTLDEAIRHAEEKAVGDSPCAREHAQLAEWLRDLKALKSLWPEDVPEEKMQGHSRWHAVALCFGYNELVKQAKTLGEKVYFRLGRQVAEESFEKLGGTPFVKEDATILELPDHMPYIRFSAKDIELMRETVRQYDENQRDPIRGC